jgi:hypothetical protein
MPILRLGPIFLANGFGIQPLYNLWFLGLGWAYVWLILEGSFEVNF